MNDPDFTGESLWARVDVPKKAWGDLSDYERGYWNDIAKRCNLGRSLEKLTQDEFEKRLGAAKNELAAHLNALERSESALTALQTKAYEEHSRAAAAIETHTKEHNRIFAIADEARKTWDAFERENERRAKPQPGWTAE